MQVADEHYYTFVQKVADLIDKVSSPYSLQPLMANLCGLFCSRDINETEGEFALFIATPYGKPLWFILQKGHNNDIRVRQNVSSPYSLQPLTANLCGLSCSRDTNGTIEMWGTASSKW